MKKRLPPESYRDHLGKPGSGPFDGLRAGFLGYEPCGYGRPLMRRGVWSFLIV